MARPGIRPAPSADGLRWRFRIDVRADPALSESGLGVGWPGCGRTEFGHLHSLDHRLCPAKPEVDTLAVRHRCVRTESGTLAECTGLAGGLVYRPALLALDLLAGRVAVAADVVLYPSRHAAPTGQPRCAAHRGWLGHVLCCLGVLDAVRRIGSGQSAGLAQFRHRRRIA